MRRARWAALLLVVLALGMTGTASATAPLAPASTPGVEPPGRGLTAAWQGPPGWSTATRSCLGTFHRPPTGSLTQSTSAGPDQGSVLPGQKITVTLTWKPGEFVWSAPSKLADCVWIGPHLSSSLSQLKGPAPTGGTYTFTYIVPVDGTGGDAVCSRGMAWGRDDHGGNWGGPHGGTWGGDQRGWGHGESASWAHPDNTEASAIVCYTILAASAPEAPAALLFPLAGFAIVGGGVLLVRRRRTRLLVDR